MREGPEAHCRRYGSEKVRFRPCTVSDDVRWASSGPHQRWGFDGGGQLGVGCSGDGCWGCVLRGWGLRLGFFFAGFSFQFRGEIMLTFVYVIASNDINMIHFIIYIHCC